MMGRAGKAAGGLFRKMPNGIRRWMAVTGWTVKLLGAGAASYTYVQEISWMSLVFLFGVVFGVFLEQLSIVALSEPSDGWWKNTARHVLDEALTVAMLAIATDVPGGLGIYGLIAVLVVAPAAILIVIRALLGRDRVLPTLARINAKSGATLG